MFDAIPILAAAPWIIAAVLVPLLLLGRKRISAYPPLPPERSPRVSIIVPARNEADNISACVATLLNSEYPNFELVVVDDQSQDGTADIVRLIASRSNGRLRLVDGTAPPPGWIGKSWACWQGYQAAGGELLLFADADTRHDEDLVGHAVAGLEAVGAELVSVLPRQRMLTFWERLVLPQIFATITLRYHDVDRISRAGNPRNVIANGQFMLFRRAAYERIGGHEVVRHDVVEDMALAQQLVASGGRLLLAHADDLMDTRMYRSLGEISEGWTKNLARGAGRAVPGWLAPLAPWLLALFTVLVWCVPPVVLALSIFTPIPPAVQGWSLLATAAGTICWAGVNATMRVPPQHGLLFPLGAAIVAVLFVKSALRGPEIHWRGRRYAPPATTP